MSKHTPGPWIGKDENGRFNSNHEWVARDEDASCSDAAPIWAGGKVIAIVVHSSDRFSIESHQSIDANARLIAAAPELLEALLECERYGGGYTNCVESYLPPTVREKARAAIAKAETEQ